MIDLVHLTLPDTPTNDEDLAVEIEVLEIDANRGFPSDFVHPKVRDRTSAEPEA